MKRVYLIFAALRNRFLPKFQEQPPFRKPNVMQYLFDFGYICFVQAAGLVHALNDLVDIVSYALKLGGMVLNVGMIYVDDIPVNRNLAYVRAHILCLQQSHFLLYKSLFFLGYSNDNLNIAFSVLRCHIVKSSFMPVITG